MIFWKIRLALVDFFFKSFYPLIDTLVGLAVFVHFINGESDDLPFTTATDASKVYPAVSVIPINVQPVSFKSSYRIPMPSQNVSLYESESPQPNRATNLWERSAFFRTLTPSYQSSCNSPAPQVEVPSTSTSYSLTNASVNVEASWISP